MLCRPLILIAVVVIAGGCERVMYDPAMATRPYPEPLHQTGSVDVQVFRKGPHMEIVNSTPTTYRDFDIWINQRFVMHMDVMRAGETVRLSLWDFWDVRGDRFSAGGFWRTEEPTPLRLVQLEVGDEQPLIGLITVTED